MIHQVNYHCKWHLAVEIATVVCATAVYVLQVPIDIKFENQEIYDTAFVIEKYTDIAKWFEFKNTKAFWPFPDWYQADVR